MQNAFVISRLFKKQDETIEDVNGDEVDPGVTTPTEEMQSELEVPQDSPPSVERKAEEISNGSGIFPVGLHNGMISDAVIPILECNNNDPKAYSVTGHVVETAPVEVRK